MEPTERQPGTRERLLESAIEVFAAKGYHEATIAEICEQAGANIAGVNYHFGDKEHLYVKAWHVVFRRSLTAHPADGGVPADAPAQERLRGRVLSLVERIMDPACHEFDIVHKEIANPTGLLMAIVHESIEPIRREMTKVIGELLGDGVSEAHVRLCEMSVVSQCIHLMMRQRFHRVGAGERGLPGPEPLAFDAETLADHVVRFSLAGLREVRRQVEAGELSRLDMECADGAEDSDTRGGM